MEEMVAEGYAIRAYLRHKYYVIGPVLTDGHVRTVGEDTKVVTVVDYDDLELTIFTVFMVRGPQVNAASVELTEAVLLLLRSFILDMSGTVGYGGRG